MPVRKYPEFLTAKGLERTIAGGPKTPFWLVRFPREEMPTATEFIASLEDVKWDAMIRLWKVPQTPDNARALLRLANLFSFGVYPLALDKLERLAKP